MRVIPAVLAVLVVLFAPIWLAATDEPPARVVGISLAPTALRDTLDSIFSLATKYDLVVFALRAGRQLLALDELLVDVTGELVRLIVVPADDDFVHE